MTCPPTTEIRVFRAFWPRSWTARSPRQADRLAGVSHAYGSRKALDDVSMNAEQGQFSALLGLNGAGDARCQARESIRFRVTGHTLNEHDPKR
jgi:ABC-type phosphonate transport system ATPase subunit